MSGSGEPLRQVKRSTMTSPIRYGGPDKRIRGSVNPSTNPLKATGKAINSITSKKINKNTQEVAPNTPHGKMIFEYNAHKAKTKRDPIIISDKQVKLIEDSVVDALTKELFK